MPVVLGAEGSTTVSLVERAQEVVNTKLQAIPLLRMGKESVMCVYEYVREREEGEREERGREREREGGRERKREGGGEERNYLYCRFCVSQSLL